MKHSEDTLLKLLELHHIQLMKRREKIQFMSRGSALFFVTLAGLVTTASDDLAAWSIGLVIVAIPLLALALGIKLYQDGQAHVQILKILHRVNHELGLFEPGSALDRSPLYPQEWEEAPKTTPFQSVAHHLFLIGFSALAAAIFLFQFTQTS